MAGVPGEVVEWVLHPASRVANPNARAVRVRTDGSGGCERRSSSIPFDPFWRGRSRHRRLEAQTKQSVPRDYSDLTGFRPGKRASLPVSRRFQLIMSGNAPVALPRRSIAVGYDWRCRVPDASREFQARTDT